VKTKKSSAFGCSRRKTKTGEKENCYCYLYIIWHVM